MIRRSNYEITGFIGSDVDVIASYGCAGFEKPVSDGMDKAILNSFREATASSAIDDTSKISLDEIKSAVSSLRINNDNFEISFDEGKLKNLLSSQGIASWNGLSDPVSSLVS